MIVETMNYDEIIKTFFKDWKKYSHNFIINQISDRKYRRAILKLPSHIDGKYMFKPIFYTSPNKINYIFLVSTTGKHDYKVRAASGFEYMVIVYYVRNGETYVMTSSPGTSIETSSFRFYSAHLFKRYRERELKDTSYPIIDTIIKYFKNNYSHIGIKIESDKYKNSIFSRTNQGVILGAYVSPNILEERTYISLDMLKGSQIENSDTLIEDVDLFNLLKKNLLIK